MNKWQLTVTKNTQTGETNGKMIDFEEYARF